MIVASTQVAITAALLSALAEKNIALVFCDWKHDPQAQVISYCGTYDSPGKLKSQFEFNQDTMNNCWRRIVQAKIHNQAANLKARDEASFEKLCEYEAAVESGDATNREGHAAKVYFNTLFGTGFSRGSVCFENTCLDYGYSILLSAISRAIKMHGYYLEIGIHHIGKSNPFNFACDLMEPLRPLVDSLVIAGSLTLDTYKHAFIDLMSREVRFAGRTTLLETAINDYVGTVIRALNENDPELIEFIDYGI